MQILRGEQLKRNAASYFIKNNKGQRIFHLKYPPNPIFINCTVLDVNSLIQNWKEYVLEGSKSLISESHT